MPKKETSATTPQPEPKEPQKAPQGPKEDTPKGPPPKEEKPESPKAGVNPAGKVHIKVDRALAAGRSAIGLPFTHQGRGAGKGFDCWGVLLHMLHAGGWKARSPETAYVTNYSMTGSWRQIEIGFSREAYRIPYSELMPLDCLLIQWPGHRIPQHFAVVSQVTEIGVYVIHTHRTLREVREQRVDAELKGDIHSCWRFYGRLPNDPLEPKP